MTICIEHAWSEYFCIIYDLFLHTWGTYGFQHHRILQIANTGWALCSAENNRAYIQLLNTTRIESVVVLFYSKVAQNILKLKLKLSCQSLYISSIKFQLLNACQWKSSQLFEHKNEK